MSASSERIQQLLKEAQGFTDELRLHENCDCAQILRKYCDDCNFHKNRLKRYIAERLDEANALNATFREDYLAEERVKQQVLYNADPIYGAF
jgi:hypothetical protein